MTMFYLLKIVAHELRKKNDVSKKCSMKAKIHIYEIFQKFKYLPNNILIVSNEV